MDSDSNEEIFKCSSYQKLPNELKVNPKRSKIKIIMCHIKDKGSVLDLILKSFLYAMCGCIIAYFIFSLMVHELSISLFLSVILCILFGLVLVIGMTCSKNFRCLVCLIVPQLFSKRGRQALLAYAFIITLTGPTKNTMQNISRLSESLVCSRAQLKEASHELKKAMEQPFYAIKDSLNKMVTSIQENVEKFKNKIHSIENVIKKIISIFDSAFSWLSSVVGICNKKLGTPYERCTRSLEVSRKNCTLKVPMEYIWACEPSGTAGALCFVAKTADYMCQLVDVIDEKVVEVLKKKLNALSERTKEMLYFSVDFSHSFEFDTDSSKSGRQVASEVMKDLIVVAKKLDNIFGLTGALFSVFVLLLILRVIWYRQRVLASDRFDNHFITSDMKNIDEERISKLKTSILPLNKRESRRYIPATSLRLVRSEKISLLKTGIFLSLTTIKMAVHMMADYCLFWLMDTIYTFGMLQSNIPVNTGGVEMIVKGEGLSADLYRSMGDSLSLNVSNVKFDPKLCLAIPNHPKYEVYRKIAYILLLCWISTIFEPYGLRVRHLIMTHFYPDRAHQRALWLYHDILRRRSSFLAITKRKIKDKLSRETNDDHERTTFQDYFVARLPCLRSVLKDSSKENCTVCGDRLGNVKKCISPECPGKFCKQCFLDLNSICPVCKISDDVESCSDFSIERGSSDEDIHPKTAPSYRFYTDSMKDDEVKESLCDTKNRSHTVLFDSTSESEYAEASSRKHEHYKQVKSTNQELELNVTIDNWISDLQLFNYEQSENNTNIISTDDGSGTDNEKQSLVKKNSKTEVTNADNVPVFTWESMKKNIKKKTKKERKLYQMIYDTDIENSDTFEERRKESGKMTLCKIRQKLSRQK